jgi:hypothetical protein
VQDAPSEIELCLGQENKDQMMEARNQWKVTEKQRLPETMQSEGSRANLEEIFFS